MQRKTKTHNMVGKTQKRFRETDIDHHNDLRCHSSTSAISYRVDIRVSVVFPRGLGFAAETEVRRKRK